MNYKVELLVELSSDFVKVDEHCVTLVVRAAVTSSISILAIVIFAILDI